MSEHEHKLKSVFFSTLLFLTAFALTGLFAEVVVLLFRPPLPTIESVSDYVQFNLAYGLEPKPSISYKEYGIDVTTNRNAMYGPEIAKDKKGFRIAYLGDSYTAGPGIRFEQNFPYLTSQKLEQSFPSLDYLIGGLAGSSPSQQHLIYQKKIAPYQPDIVVYQLFENDINDDLAFYYSDYYARLQIADKVPEVFYASRLVQQLMLISMEQLSAYRAHKYTAVKSPPRDQHLPVWEKYTKPALENLRTSITDQDGVFVLLYIPSGWEFDNEYATKPATDKYLMHQAAREFATNNNIPFIDTYDVFKPHNTDQLNELYLSGEFGLHLTPFAAQLVSDELIKLVEPVLQERANN